MNHASPDPKGRGCCSADGSQNRAPKDRAKRPHCGHRCRVLAFLASQHYTVMMTLFAFGLGNTAMSFMTAAPLVRDACSACRW